MLFGSNTSDWVQSNFNGTQSARADLVAGIEGSSRSSVANARLLPELQVCLLKSYVSGLPS